MSLFSFSRRTKIVCTLGPASTQRSVLRKMILAGMDVARLNLSHGTPSEHKTRIEAVRSLSRELDRPVAILADLQGPKLRTGIMQEGGVSLKTGDLLTLDVDPMVGTEARIPIQSPDFFQIVQNNDTVLMDDGLLEFMVLGVTEREAQVEVVHGGLLKDNKGINILDSRTDVSALTPKDRQDLSFALAHAVDWVALSFVQSADNVDEVQGLIKEQLPAGAMQVPVMAKIEKPAALGQIDDILELADGIMVARGDLGIETRTELVPLIQKDLILRCIRRGKPVVTATQMLESMIVNPRPTRAEASDVANAVIDGTDGIMLSGETAVGRDPANVVQTMATIVEATEADAAYHQPPPAPAEGDIHPIAVSIAKSTVQMVDEVEAKAILAPTASGYTAKMLSRFRPRVPIVALTPNTRVQHQLCVFNGVHGLDTQDFETAEEVTQEAIDRARRGGVIKEGDRVVVTSGTIIGIPGMTNNMMVRTAVRPILRGLGMGRMRILGQCVLWPQADETELDLAMDHILVAPEFGPECVALAQHCAGLITSSRRMDVQRMMDNVPSVMRAGVFETYGDFEHLHDGQMLVMDSLTGRIFDYQQYSAS